MALDKVRCNEIQYDMLDTIPSWVNFLFILSLIYTLIIFYYSNGKPNKVLIGILVWSIFLSILSKNHFFLNTDTIPPRFLIVLIPIFTMIIIGSNRKSMAWVHEVRQTKYSILLHAVRFPIELILLQLFLAGSIPNLMTFEGFNFDIIMGITAPIIWLLIINKKIKKRYLLLWNYLGLFLIFTIVIISVLSPKLPIQILAYDQPNIGINYFPFILLPGVIVPLVIWTHITDILVLKRSNNNKDI